MTTTAKPSVTSPAAKVGTATKIAAVHPISQLVYPVYADLLSNGNVSAFTFIKAREVFGPFADPYVARDEAQRRLQWDIEHGIVNP